MRFYFILVLSLLFGMSSASAITATEFQKKMLSKMAQVEALYQDELRVLNESPAPDYEKKFRRPQVQEKWAAKKQEVRNQWMDIYLVLVEQERTGLDNAMKINIKKDAALRELNSWRDRQVSNINLTTEAAALKQKKVMELNAKVDLQIRTIRQNALNAENRLIAIQQQAQRKS